MQVILLSRPVLHASQYRPGQVGTRTIFSSKHGSLLSFVVITAAAGFFNHSSYEDQ